MRQSYSQASPSTVSSSRQGARAPAVEEAAIDVARVCVQPAGRTRRVVIRPIEQKPEVICARPRWVREQLVDQPTEVPPLDWPRSSAHVHYIDCQHEVA